MSHELRTPLNSLLILSDQLSQNPEGNLTRRQIEFAKTIHASGNDLLTLINDILDLSKIESGTVVVDVGEVRFADLAALRRAHLPPRRGGEGPRLRASTSSRDLPRAMRDRREAPAADPQEPALERVQVHRARRGRRSRSAVATGGWSADNETLERAPARWSRSRVADTGIGIPPEKQQIIFEAFQQADGSTSRSYGGTGLGLAISREIARLLGGEIRVDERAGRGQHVHALPAAHLRGARQAAAPSDGAERDGARGDAARARGARDDARRPWRRTSRRRPTTATRSARTTACC